MIRTQIQLTEEQSHLLHEEARRSGKSVAEIVRRSVDGYLERERSAAPGAASRLAAGQVAGLFRSGKSDVAEQHDAYLDESYST